MTDRFYILTPKAPRAYRILEDAGKPERWALVERRYSAPFTERSGPWLLLRPDTHGQSTHHQRWVHETEDTYFTCGPA